MLPIILMYHSIVQKESNDPYAISVSIFKNQILTLLNSGYTVISLEKLVNLINNPYKFLIKKYAVLTFDDGYQDFIINAVPVLQQYGLPATVFIVTEMFGKTAEWSQKSKNVRLMSEKEILTIRELGINIGSHTRMHVDLTKLNDNELENELKNSRQKLIDLGENFFSFSYPWGRYSKREILAVGNAGYHCGVTTNNNHILLFNNPYRLGRININKNMSMQLFEEIVKK
jgi:peptidoglycan/xylan/chitin deacetylase (PgdA/CDA1 family)